MPMRIPDVSRPSFGAVVGLALLLVGCAQSSATKAPAMPKPPAPPSPPPTSTGSASAGSGEAQGEKQVEAGKKATAKSEAAKQGQKGEVAATGEAAASGATTPDERRSAIDGQLQASMAEFDGMLLKEQKAIEDKQRKEPLPERGEGSGGAGAGKEGSSGSAAGKGGSAGRAGSTESKDDRTPAERRAEAEARKGKDDKGASAPATGDKGTGDSRDSGQLEGGAPVTAPVEGGSAGPGSDSAGVPRDVGDGRSDDVVARQLREAAMKEKDPAIRERLWDEYREYKKSAGKGGD